MLASLKKRFSREDEGFTLIELMVVVLIIAILLAIAIPTFLGAQDRARDRAAQSNLRNGITAAKTLATDADGFFLVGTAAVTATDLAGVEGSLTFSQGALASTAASGVVGVVSDTVAPQGENIVLMAKSGSGKFFCMAATSSGTVTYGSNSDPAAIDTVGECNGTKF